MLTPFNNTPTFPPPPVEANHPISVALGTLPLKIFDKILLSRSSSIFILLSLIVKGNSTDT